MLDGKKFFFFQKQEKSEEKEKKEAKEEKNILEGVKHESNTSQVMV